LEKDREDGIEPNGYDVQEEIIEDLLMRSEVALATDLVSALKSSFKSIQKGERGVFHNSNQMLYRRKLEDDEIPHNTLPMFKALAKGYISLGMNLCPTKSEFPEDKSVFIMT